MGRMERLTERVAHTGYLRFRIAMIAQRVVDKWEAPEGRRRYWRRRKPGGGYEYREEPPEGEGSRVVQEGPADVETKKQPEKSKKVWKHHVVLKSDELRQTLSRGHFSIVSAGRNSNDPKEAKMSPDDEFFHKRHEQLKGELEKKGIRYTDVVGHYGGKETSFLVFHDEQELTPKTQKSVMVHYRDSDELKRLRRDVEGLGKKFNQDSVLHGSGGKNILVFTTGKNAGKECGGKGWKETPKAKDFYTDIKLEEKKHTKFALDISECFEKGFL